MTTPVSSRNDGASPSTLFSSPTATNALANVRLWLKECTGIGLKPLDHLDEALLMCRVRRHRHPDAQVFASIENQLVYLHGLVDGSEPDRSRLRDIALGRYQRGAEEGFDTPFARALANASRIADCLAASGNLDALRLRRAGRRPY